MSNLNTAKAEISNRISGIINLKDTGAGIQNLLVVIYDLDPGVKPEEIINKISNENSNVEGITNKGKQPVNNLGFLGDRLGSILSAEDGTFELTYEDQEFQILNETEKRPDLFLMLLAPEEVGRPFHERILFYSSEIRQNAGRKESYFIQLTAKLFKDKNIEIPLIKKDATL